MWLLAGVVLAVLGFGELEHWRASKRFLGTAGAAPGGRESVVVLGYRNRGNQINFLNRWRVRVGLRSRTGPDSTLILSGGSHGATYSEAALMTDYAKARGHTGPLIAEPDSCSTWQNIENVIPFLEDAGTIKIASNSLHAEKARAYLWKQRPDLATRLVRAQDYRFGEWTIAKPALTLYGYRNRRIIHRLGVQTDRTQAFRPRGSATR